MTLEQTLINHQYVVTDIREGVALQRLLDYGLHRGAVIRIRAKSVDRMRALIELNGRTLILHRCHMELIEVAGRD